MWYTTRYENTHFYSTTHPGRTAADPGRIALVGCLRVTPLPDSVGFCSQGTRSRHCTCAGLRRPNCAQRDPRLQCHRAGRLAGRIVAPASLTNGLTAEKAEQLKDLLHR